MPKPYRRNNKNFWKAFQALFHGVLNGITKVTGQNISAMKWIKPEEFANLTEMAEHKQRTSLKNI